MGRGWGGRSNAQTRHVNLRRHRRRAPEDTHAHASSRDKGKIVSRLCWSMTMHQRWGSMPKHFDRFQRHLTFAMEQRTARTSSSMLDLDLVPVQPSPSIYMVKCLSWPNDIDVTNACGIAPTTPAASFDRIRKLDLCTRSCSCR